MPSKAERGAGCIGAHPGVAFGVSALITTILSLIALFVGEFEVSADNAGWESRTTTMANRQVQFRTLQKCYTLDEDCWMSDSVLLLHFTCKVCSHIPFVPSQLLLNCLGFGLP